MNEQLEKLRDEALLAQFPIDKQLKITMGLTLVIQRQLALLSEKTGTPIEAMDRSFILKNLANVEVTDEAIDNANAVVDKVLKSR